MLQAMSIETSAGPLRVASRGGTVCLTRLGVPEDEFLDECFQRFGEIPLLAEDSKLKEIVSRRLLENVPVPFDLGKRTAFQRDVLEAVFAIPRGEVRTYGEVAYAVGRPRAARAVGEVMRTNPIPVLIPCHRVVRRGGSIGNYSPRPELKRQFLIEEGAIQS